MRIPNKTAKTEQNSGLRGRVNASTEDLRFGVGGLATYGGGGSGENGLGKKGETGDMLSNRVKGLGVGGGERRCLVSPMTRSEEEDPKRAPEGRTSLYSGSCPFRAHRAAGRSETSGSRGR